MSLKLSKPFWQFCSPPSNKVFVRNCSGHNIIIYVSPTRSLRELLFAGAKAAAQHKVGLQRLALTAKEMERRGFDVEEGAKGAFVTIARTDDVGQLFCADLPVRVDHCLLVGAHTFSGTVLLEAAGNTTALQVLCTATALAK